MRRIERREITVTRDVVAECTCDRCGVSEKGAEMGWLCPVVIEVNYGEEFGSRDVYDYCNPCLIEMADILRAAGSRSALLQESPE